MRTKVSAFTLLSAAVLLGLTLPGCQLRTENNSDPTKFQDTELTARQMGLAPKQIALTFDDGPSAHSLRLAKELLKQNVPATFFWLGEAAAKPALAPIAKAISEMKFPNGEYAFNIGSHAHSHAHLPTAGYIEQVIRAHKVLQPYYKKNHFFFRPPYGAWGGKEFSERMNAETKLNLDNYIGPVWWDVGAILSLPYTADYGCWSQKMSVQACGAGYEREISDKNGGIVLAHDVYKETVDMFVGNESYAGIVQKMKKKGYTFVALDHNKEQTSKLARITAPEFSVIDCKITSFQNSVVEGTVSVSDNSVDSIKTCVDFWGKCHPTTEVHQKFKLEVKNSSIIKRHVVRSLGYKNGRYVASSACAVYDHSH